MVHFPSCDGGRADFKELEKQLEKVVNGYKHVTATRMFAFGHSFEQGDYPDILDPQRDIVFPPEQEFEVRGLDFFVRVLHMYVESMSTWVQHGKPSSGLTRCVVVECKFG